MRTFNIFISHSWKYGDSYDRLTKLLSARGYFSYRDYSVPKDDPIHTRGTDRELKAAIKRHMSPTHVIVILAGVYATYSKWINQEILIAKTGFSTPKPVLAIQPWGAERTSRVVQSAADKVVGWNTESVVRAIRELA